MTTDAKPDYGFGEFLLDTDEQILLRYGEPVPITLKAFKILLLLVQNRGHIVGKHELMEAVWPNTFVEEANLTQHIFLLRKILSESGNGHRYIETISKRGYRFNSNEKDASRKSEGLAPFINPDERRLAMRSTIKTEVYKLYLKGRYFWNKRTAEDLKRGVSYFGEAIQKDPDFALAYTGIAESFILFGSYNVMPPKESLGIAKAMAIKAPQIDNSLAEAQAALALATLNYDWDWAGAAREYKHAIELNPGYPMAHLWHGMLLAKRGLFDQAMSEMRQAQDMDPLSLIIITHTGKVLYFMRQYHKAISQGLEALEMDENYAAAIALLATSYSQIRRYPEAIKQFKKLAKLLNGDPEVLAFLANTYAAAGREDEALKLLNKLKRLSKQRYISPFNLAIIYTGLGKTDLAIEWLEKAYEDRSDSMTFLKVEPIFDIIRSDPRFQDLLDRIGLGSV